MNILELQPESEIKFEVQMDNQKLEFDSKVVMILDKCILANPVKVNGKVVGITSENSLTSMFWNQGEKPPIVWRNVDVQVVAYKGTVVYMVTQTLEGKELNRRGAYRLFVGIHGQLKMSLNGRAYDVMVKDISETGFSFVYDSEIAEIEAGTLNLIFSDEGQSICLVGKFVRMYEAQPNRIVYGCKMIAKMPSIAKYISEKQRTRIAEKQGGPTIAGGTRPDAKK